MTKDRVYPPREKNITAVFDLIKQDNQVSKEAIASILKLGIVTIYRAINELKRRRWIKAKAERIGIVEQYEILKKD